MKFILCKYQLYFLDPPWSFKITLFFLPTLLRQLPLVQIIILHVPMTRHSNCHCILDKDVYTIWAATDWGSDRPGSRARVPSVLWETCGKIFLHFVSQYFLLFNSVSPPACRVIVEGDERQAPVPELVSVVDLTRLHQPQHGLDHVLAGLLQLPQLLDHAHLDQIHEARQNKSENRIYWFSVKICTQSLPPVCKLYHCQTVRVLDTWGLVCVEVIQQMRKWGASGENQLDFSANF